MIFQKKLFFIFFALFFSAIAFSLIIMIINLWAFFIPPTAKVTANNIHRHIHHIQQALSFIDDAKKNAYLNAINNDDIITLKPAHTHPPGISAKKYYQRLVANHLKAKLNNNTLEVRFEKKPRQSHITGAEKNDIIWSKVQLNGDFYWLGFARILPKGLWYDAVLLQLIFIITMTLLLAFIVTTTIKRPLSRLILAACELSKGIVPTPLIEKGAWEFKIMAQSFNKMATGLKVAADERALMLAGISHDLRTPLARIRLGIEIADNTIEKELAQGLADDIDTIDAIVGQFLAFADNRNDEVKRLVSLNSIVIDIVQRYKQTAAVTLQLNDLPDIALKTISIARLLTNLIDNALMHGGGDITITTRTQGNTIVLSVADKGEGINERECELAKQPFKRLHNARSNPHGAGLGLSIVEKIARWNNATLELKPNHGGGLNAQIVFQLTQTKQSYPHSGT